MSAPNPVLGPPPYQTPMTDKNGIIQGIWISWIKQLYVRVGQAVAPSNSVITTSSSSITVIQSNITTLNTNLIAVQAQADGLSVGRQL